MRLVGMGPGCLRPSTELRGLASGGAAGRAAVFPWQALHAAPLNPCRLLDWVAVKELKLS